MIVEEKLYGIKCDNCDELAEDFDGVCFYPDELGAMDNAMEKEWHKTDDGEFYCTDCHHFDENDVLVIGHAEKVEFEKRQFDKND